MIASRDKNLSLLSAHLVKFNNRFDFNAHSRRIRHSWKSNFETTGNGSLTPSFRAWPIYLCILSILGSPVRSSDGCSNHGSTCLSTRVHCRYAILPPSERSLTRSPATKWLYRLNKYLDAAKDRLGSAPKVTGEDAARRIAAAPFQPYDVVGFDQVEARRLGLSAGDAVSIAPDDTGKSITTAGPQLIHRPQGEIKPPLGP